MLIPLESCQFFTMYDGSDGSGKNAVWFHYSYFLLALVGWRMSEHLNDDSVVGGGVSVTNLQ